MSMTTDWFMLWRPRCLVWPIKQPYGGKVYGVYLYRPWQIRGTLVYAYSSPWDALNRQMEEITK